MSHLQYLFCSFIVAASIHLSSHAATWQTYLPSDGYHQIIDFGGYTYVHAGNMLMRDQSHGTSLKPMTFVEGLSGQSVYTIVTPTDSSFLAVLYTDGLIDVIHPDGTITSVSGLRDYSHPGVDKTIRDVSVVDHTLYIACNFGFLAVNPLEDLFLLTCPSPTPCTRAFLYNNIYYRERTGVGMESCPANANIQRAEEWQPVTDATSLPDFHPIVDHARLNTLPAYNGPDIKDCCLMKVVGTQLVAMQSVLFHINNHPHSIKGQISRLDLQSGEWSTLTYGQVLSQITEAPKNFNGLMQFTADPNDPQHLYISTMGNLLLELQGDELKRHMPSNSPLQYYSGFEGNLYGRVGGTAWDPEGNLWLINNHTSTPIHCITPQGQWYSFSSPTIFPITMSNNIIYSQSGQLWIPDGFNYPDIYIYDLHGTPFDGNDDISYKIPLANEDGNSISHVTLTNIVEDSRRCIWLLTTRGIRIIPDQEAFMADPNHCTYRPLLQKASDNDNDTYLLDGVNCQSIAFGTDDDLWIGTIGDGLYHVSADGSRILDHFTAENSPLLSDGIYALTIDPATGTVYASCDGGIVSYNNNDAGGEGNDNLPDDFSQVHISPTHLTDAYTGELVISQLPADTHLLIADAQMNILLETDVHNGRLSWNMVTQNQEYLSTGIYNIYASTPTLPLRRISSIIKTAATAPATAVQSGK